MRDKISPGRISVKDWIDVIKTAHKLGIGTTSTMMFGHIESPHDRVQHIEKIREFQKDIGGTLINESISTSAGAQHGQLLKPKEIRRMVSEINRTPAQRSTDYQILRTFENENEYEDELDTVDAKRFGSYFELIKIDKYKYKNPRRS